MNERGNPLLVMLGDAEVHVHDRHGEGDGRNLKMAASPSFEVNGRLMEEWLHSQTVGAEPYQAMHGR